MHDLAVASAVLIVALMTAELVTIALQRAIFRMNVELLYLQWRVGL